MKIMMITGAGISTGSGLTTYRGNGGKYESLEKEFGMPVERLLSSAMMHLRPALPWKYLYDFIHEIEAVSPSPTHMAMKQISDQAEGFLEVTQNIDGLSFKAGLSADNVIELHGNVLRYRCMYKHCRKESPIRFFDGMELPPKCPYCFHATKGFMRPDIVLFEESISQRDFDRARNFIKNANALIVSGTSVQFSYLAHLIIMAASIDIPIIYIDPNASIDNEVINHVMSNTGFRYELNLHDHVYMVKEPSDTAMASLANFLARPDVTDFSLRSWAMARSSMLKSSISSKGKS